jgi:hypothetical protein
MQRELKRVGCYAGPVNGNWGTQSRKALERFNAAAKLELELDPPSAQGVTKVQSFTGAVCEQVRQADGKKRSGGPDAAVGGFVGGLVGGYIGSKVRGR